MSNVWQDLNHETIFSSVEGALSAKLSGLLRQRNSYINRVYELERAEGNERLIAKFYRPLRWTRGQILEEHAFLDELLGSDVPVIAPMKFKGQSLFSLQGAASEIFFCIFPKRGGRALDELDKEAWKNIGRHLARLHKAGERHNKTERITWKPSFATKGHLDALLSSDLIPEDFRTPMEDASEDFIEKADPLFNKTPLILIHGDCHKGNLISRPGEGIFLIDFDDMCMGPAVQDLWMLLSGSPKDCESELQGFFEGYNTFREFDAQALELVPALRGMRLIHFASWLAVQSSDPHFDKHFPEARTPKYWNGLINEVQELVYKTL